MTKSHSFIAPAKARILNKDPSQRSIWFLTYNGEVYNGEIFLEIIKPFVEWTKNKVKALLFWDELEIASAFNKKTEWLISGEKLKRMKEYENLKKARKNLEEIKKDPDFIRFKEIFLIAKTEYKKNKNKWDIDLYLDK